MDAYEQILEAIFEAIREVNEQNPDGQVAESPDTVLMGKSGELSSLGIVTLATVAEENLDRIFDQSISVMDILMAVDSDSFDVADLAHRVAKRIGCAVPD